MATLSRFFADVALILAAAGFCGVRHCAGGVRFSTPNQSFGNAQFGSINPQSNLPRIVQFALKLIY